MAMPINKIQKILEGLDKSVEKDFPLLASKPKRRLNESIGNKLSFSTTPTESAFDIINLKAVYPELQEDYDVNDVFGVLYWDMEIEPRKQGCEVTLSGEMREVRFSLDLWGSENGGTRDEKIDTTEYEVDFSDFNFSPHKQLFINNVEIDVYNKKITIT